MIYVISKVVSAFLLPPGIFVSLFLLFWLMYRKRVFLLLALVVWILCTKPFGNMVIASLENRQFHSCGQKPVAVVVLGGGEAKGAPNLPTSAAGTKRILYGLMVAYTKNLPLVLSGRENGSVKETLLQIDEALSLGVRQSHTLKPHSFIVEGKSKDTYENALYTSRLLPPSSTVFLVTSAYHMPRSVRLFRHFGICPIPKKTDYKYDARLEFQDFLPSFGGLKRLYLALHEYLGLLSLGIRGID